MAGPLTVRQVEVLNLIAAGYDTPGIAVKLFISEDTVKTLRTRIYAALCVHNATTAVLAAARRGLIQIPGLVPGEHPAGAE